MSIFKNSLDDSISLRKLILEDAAFQDEFQKIVSIVEDCFRSGGKLLLCGNGGSASDAQHISAELSGRFKLDREPLFAEALHVNSSYLTAVANDYGFDEVYARMTKAMGRKNDVLIGLSTSGNSKNVRKALEVANTIGMTTIAFLGENLGEIGKIASLKIQIPSGNTARIQEIHITLGHILCEEIENRIFKA
jgi:D-sedoheptulose 7-phosphate isomerase